MVRGSTLSSWSELHGSADQPTSDVMYRPFWCDGTTDPESLVRRVQPAGGTAARADWVSVDGRVSIAEISGSESVVHFEMQGQTWISQSHGVHTFAVGEIAPFRLEVARGLYFESNGRCVAAATS